MMISTYRFATRVSCVALTPLPLLALAASACSSFTPNPSTDPDDADRAGDGQSLGQTDDASDAAMDAPSDLGNAADEYQAYGTSLADVRTVLVF